LVYCSVRRCGRKEAKCPRSEIPLRFGGTIGRGRPELKSMSHPRLTRPLTHSISVKFTLNLSGMVTPVALRQIECPDLLEIDDKISGIAHNDTRH